MWIAVTLSSAFVRSLCGVALVASLAACDSAPSPLPAPLPPSPACPRDDQAPLLRSLSGPSCIAVGADLASSGGEWPAPAGDPEPVVYVRPGIGAGTGTREAPFRDLNTALTATPAPATIVLARGTYTLPTALTVTRSVTLRGVGASDDATVLTAPRGVDAIRVRAPGGVEPSPEVSVTLARLKVRGDASSAPGGQSAGVRVEGPRSTLTLRDVVVERMDDGVRVHEGATLCARGVSLRRSRRAGLVVLGGMALVTGGLIRDGDNVGVLADGSVLAMRSSLVAGNAREGVVVRGARSNETRCTPPGDGGVPSGECTSLSLCGESTIAHECATSLAVPPGPGEPGMAAVSECRGVSTLEEVVMIDNGVVGVRAERVPPPPDAGTRERNEAFAQPGARLRVTRALIGGTRAPPGESSGDGLYVGPTASVTLDPNIVSEDAGVPGSIITSNARAGVLVDGDRGSTVPNPLRAQGLLAASGTTVRYNRGPGIYVQERAVATRLAFGLIHDNTALGLGVTAGGRVPLIQCEHFTGTRAGTIVTERGSLTLADGLSMSEDTAATTIEQSEFSGNARYGMIIIGIPVSLVGANTARANVQGVGFFNNNVTGSEGSLERVVRGGPPPEVARGAVNISTSSR